MVLKPYPRNMNKIICICMISWLPCFMAAANAMGMQMALDNALPHTTQPAEHAQMACHEAPNLSKVADSNANDSKTSPSSAHHCSFCGFCVVGSAIASLPTIKLNHTKSASTQPTSFEVAFSSQDYPPAHKPPILN